MRRSTSTDRLASWLTFPPRYTNSFVWLYTWPAASTLNVAVDPDIRFARKHMISVLASDTVRPNAAHSSRPPPSSSSAARVISRRPRHRQRKACPKAASRGLTLRQLLPLAPPAPLFFLRYTKASMMPLSAFKRVKATLFVYNRREEDVEQKGREYASLTKALFQSKPPRAHPVVEPHACSHAIVESMNDRDHILMEW